MTEGASGGVRAKRATVSRVVLDACVLADLVNEAESRHDVAVRLHRWIVESRVEVVVPMHAVFELRAALIGRHHWNPPAPVSFFRGLTGSDALPVNCVPIDQAFVDKYLDAALPHARGGDLIYLALAHRDRLTLITADGPLLKAARSAGVEAYTPDELLGVLAD